MSKKVTITFNGKNIEAEEGANVLQVAKDNGINIAHYCYHEGLSIAGVCRLCMVKVNGNPKPVPSCNLTVQDGMTVDSESEDIKEIVRWGLQFHLANHPLDCPICDQAGECVLQESYMEYGAYDSNMTENKVQKKKVVDLGPTIMLDKERCILCTRCTRFTSEVTKTHDLGIFERGNRSEIGTYDNKPFENDYSVNTVDICPVGALTSKDFRFKQRVWYTRTSPSVCIKCSTGCNTEVSHNKRGAFRIKPRKNEDVNGLWMCDKGRTAYQWLNSVDRYLHGFTVNGTEKKHLSTAEARSMLKTHLSQEPKTGWLISPQHTVEEYEALFGYLKSSGVPNESVYLWYDWASGFEDFDGLLIRGDKSPNSKGLAKVAQKFGYAFDVDRMPSLKAKAFSQWVIVAPENMEPHTGLEKLIKGFDANSSIWLGSTRLPDEQLETCLKLLIPTFNYAEKSGTYINFANKAQTIKPFRTPNAQTEDLVELFTFLASVE